MPIDLWLLIGIIIMALALDIDLDMNSRSFGSFIRTTECKSHVQALMTAKEEHRGVVTYPRPQNINGGKTGPRALKPCELFPGASRYR